MTQGRLVHHVSIHRQILAIAVPAILANFSAALPNLADTAFIGRYGDATALGGIALGNRLALFALWAFGFLRLSAGGLTAQAFGANDRAALVANYYRALLVGGICGGFVCLVSFPVGKLFLPLFGADANVTDQAFSFWFYRSLSAPFDFTTYVILGSLIGLQRAGLALALEALLNILNVLLCYIMVAQLDWGVAGAGAATSIAQTFTALTGLLVMQRVLRSAADNVTPRNIFAVAALKRILSLNRDIFLRTVMLMFMLTYFVALGVPFGPVVLAANHILFVLLTLLAYLIDGFTQAAETLTGYAIGAKDRHALSSVIKWSSLWSFGVAGIIAALLYLFEGPLVGIFSTDQAIIDTVHAYYPWIIIAPVISVGCFQLDGIFFGATKGKEMRNSMLLSSIAAAATIHAAIPFIGNHAIWLGWTALIIFRTVTLLAFYPRIPAMIAADSSHA